MINPIVLIIEDNPLIRSNFRSLLENENYKVMEAKDGEAALKQLKMIKPDLILQDLTLPDVDYLELNHRIRSQPNGVNVPILALSGFLNKFEESQFNDEFSAVLIKPIEGPHLMEAVKSFLPHSELINKQNGQRHKVLIVDDNRAQLKILQLHLNHHGFDVEMAENGKEALEKIQNNLPTAVISDVLMPNVDGFELCLEIRRNPRSAHLPVILMTSQYLEDSDRELAKKVAANYYLTRTADCNQLINVLQECVNGNVLNPQTFADSVELFKEEHTHSLIRQLERQININASLAQRCALQLAHLSMLNSMTQALTHSAGFERTLEDILATCLDAAGISRGALYLIDNQGAMTLQKVIGFAFEERPRLEMFFECQEILTEIFSTKDVIVLPSLNVSSDFINKFITEIGMHSILLAPLISDTQCLGVLLLGSKLADINTPDSITFARNLATQIGQTIVLAKAFERIYFSEQRYKVLMDNASCGIFIFNHHLEVVELNKQAERLLNLPKENIIGKHLGDFIVEADKSYALSTLKKLAAEKIFGPNEIRIKPFNAGEKIVEYSGVEIKTANESVLMVVTTDVSERNKLKSQALMNDKLATVGTLAAGVAHEINNPISWVMNNLIFMRNFVSTLRQQSNITPEHKQLLEFDDMIHESLQGVERIRDIVKDLKGFSRMDEVDVAQIDVHEILNVAISMASLEFKYRAQLIKDYAPHLPPIIGNSGKLHQVFLNLIINAAQAIPEGCITDHFIKIGTMLDGQWIRVDIADTGAGIAPEILPRIFDPFFTTKPIGRGTGLGLSICHEIVSHLNGKIEVKSTVNAGSTFSVCLPAVQHSVSELVCKDNPQIEHKKVLVIDDEPYLLKSLQTIIKSQNSYHVITAQGGQEALKWLEEHQGQFDAIICDFQMPDINGADLYQHIAKQYAGLEKKIIFITGGLYSTTLKEFIASIDNCILEKPFTHEQLLLTIENIWRA